MAAYFEAATADVLKVISRTKIGGFRTIIGAPLLREGLPIAKRGYYSAASFGDTRSDAGFARFPEGHT
jgi:hypothetical protein